MLYSAAFLLTCLTFLALPHAVTDRLSGDGSLLGCDLLSHTPTHRKQCVSALPSTCSSVNLGSGSRLEEQQPGQIVAGKTLAFVFGSKATKNPWTTSFFALFFPS